MEHITDVEELASRIESANKPVFVYYWINNRICARLGSSLCELDDVIFAGEVVFISVAMTKKNMYEFGMDIVPYCEIYNNGELESRAELVNVRQACILIEEVLTDSIEA